LPEATTPQPVPAATPQSVPAATTPTPKPSKGFWGSRFW
jgi:hypothetical protein